MSKRNIFVIVLIAAGTTAVFMLQRAKATTEITPRPVLYLVADTQRELERIPLELTRVSDSEENKIGDQLAKNEALDREDQSSPDAERITYYLNEVGARVASHVRRKAIHYHFHYVPNGGFINAYAMPGGHIVVGRGMLRLMESEDELAAVLGHEITHVDNRHAIERLQYELASRKLGLDGLYQLGAPGVQLFEAGYSKEQELEADRVGLGFAVRAGYSAAGGISIMQHFQALRSGETRRPGSLIEELADVPLQSIEEYFRSHPPEEERITAMQKEIHSQGWSLAKPQRSFVLRPIFLTEAAAALDQRGDFPAAIAKYREAIQQDPRYLPARQGLAVALWRSGDAAGAATAAADAVALNPNVEPAWLLFAQALAVADPRTSFATFQEALKTHRPQNQEMRERLQITQFGLRLFAGERDSVDSYRTFVSAVPNSQQQAAMRHRMGRWLYRAGDAKHAVEELEAARQLTPQDEQIDIDLGWAYTDLGRQADAGSSVTGSRQAQVGGCDREALQAVISWRTEQNTTAQFLFQRCAQFDAVWLQPHWASQNYSVESAKVLDQLRGLEIARRKEEERQRAKEALGR